MASSASVFHIAEYKKVALPAIICSTVCICCAGMFVLIDMGGIQRVWRILVGPNPTSPLVWDVCVISCYLIINIVYLVFMCSKKPGAADKVSIVSRFALPIAILVHSVTAWIFGLQVSKEWYTAIMAPIFVASAMDSGLALLLLALMGLNKSGVFKVENKLISSLAGLLAVCIAVDAFFIGCECLTMAYPGAKGAEALSVMAGGITAPFFWIEIIGGLLIPFLLMVFAKNRANMKLVGLACVLVVAGVFCKRIWLLFTSFYEFNIAGAPGVISGSQCGPRRFRRGCVRHVGYVRSYVGGNRGGCRGGLAGRVGVHRDVPHVACRSQAGIGKGERMDYGQLADALAFCGNSLLAPMTQRTGVGLDPGFWESFPLFGDQGVADAVQDCAVWAAEFERRCQADGQSAVERWRHRVHAAVRGAAASGSCTVGDRTLRGGGRRCSTVGFGQATFEMRELLRNAGLQLCNENRQYEDHMGIELLLLSELCRRAAANDGLAAAEASAFAADHPAAWVEGLRSAAAEAVPMVITPAC